MGADAIGARDRRARDLLITIATAVVLCAPAILGPLRLNDSFWIDWVWLDQFAAQLRSGVAYPRWLPLSHGGLGSPVFYYYPPLAFYVGSVFQLAGLSTYASVMATFLAGMVLSGTAMYFWLRENQANFPLVGAIVFMAAPYHLYDFYQRGAVAEFLAISILPIAMLGLRRLQVRERGGLVITALAYGALVATHLPLALLASLFLIAPYALAIARPDPRALLRIALALGLGAALAAVYVLPAVVLEPFRDSKALWIFKYYQPSSWTVWDPEFWQFPAFIWALLLASAVAVPSIVLLLVRRSAWSGLALLCVLLAVGMVPALWELPLLRSIQFPFRLLPVAEFALAMAVASSPASMLPRMLMALSPIAVASALAITAPPSLERLSMNDLKSVYPDVPENLPPGERPYSWPSKWAVSLAAAHKTAQVRASHTVEPVFYFPAWQVRCNGKLVQSFPDPETKLLAYRGSDCSRSIALTWPERLGAAISGLALLVLLLLGLGARFLGKLPRRDS